VSLDSHGHILLSPVELHKMAEVNRIVLINFFLMRGTPLLFPDYKVYCGLLNDVSSRIGVHPNNLFLRGSCHLGYSIAPKSKVWTPMDTKSKPSDLDLVIVDVLAHCGQPRGLSAFIFRDWLSARRRYEFDIAELLDGIGNGDLTAPPN